MKIHPIITDHSVLVSLAWSVAGHTIDTTAVITPGNDVTGLIINDLHNSGGPQILLDNGTQTAFFLLTDAHHFTFTTSTGDLRLNPGSSIVQIRGTSSILWQTDGAGDIGAATATRPNNVYVKNDIAAGNDISAVNNVSATSAVSAGTDVSAVSEIYNQKAKMTSIGGFAVKLTNKTGGNTVAGQVICVYTASAIDNAFATCGANALNPIGIVLDAGIADASEAWIVIAGIADVLMDGGGSARGDRLITSATAGSADVNNAPAVAVHFQEIGHSTETRAGAGLARAVVHFL